ncbi:EI24 domain-containing protein [Sneathiella glossodoripedis]|uniref:EI24 domain-containing protein n=1 Tax=Sneathiella glossodoripedis TaxID=418853 RepID=UPI0004718DC5|nr:EI24 domain-containing protein [Sneathiella glossodoripedis]
MLSAISKSIAQLSDPAFRSVIIKSLIAAVVAQIIAFIVIFQLTGLIPPTDWEWVNSVIEVLSGIGAFVIALLLFPLAMSAVIGVLLDDIADAVEAKHYPQDTPSRDIPLWSSVYDAVKFFGVIILLNLLVLPLYLIPVINIFIYYLLNGYLLSREFFQQVAVRHHEMRVVSKLRKIGNMEIFLTGVAIAFFMTIPILNLIVPIIATATMVHLYKARAKSAAGSALVKTQ